MLVAELDDGSAGGGDGADAGDAGDAAAEDGGHQVQELLGGGRTGVDVAEDGIGGVRSVAREGFGGFQIQEEIQVAAVGIEPVDGGSERKHGAAWKRMGLGEGGGGGGWHTMRRVWRDGGINWGGEGGMTDRGRTRRTPPGRG